ncbi:hypothetical protein D7Z96_16175 [Pseudarthrobacter phenanthrenivorans]|uniref:Uncharacterized protein n=1 Tax=Pseudarthrobacter phenanthrenivorans TaxID=361575 RepID=A0A3B0FIW8_PSEPS|nr:hypothetical protein D7Z96_16175 [Pseudarthrobacter phenanthrenivorans]
MKRSEKLSSVPGRGRSGDRREPVAVTVEVRGEDEDAAFGGHGAVVLGHFQVFGTLDQRLAWCRRHLAGG